jgi:hypothetical protein
MAPSSKPGGDVIRRLRGDGDVELRVFEGEGGLPFHARSDRSEIATSLLSYRYNFPKVCRVDLMLFVCDS